MILMNKISTTMKLLLLNVHENNINTMLPEEKENHSLFKIVKVTVDHKTKSI